MDELKFKRMVEQYQGGVLSSAQQNLLEDWYMTIEDHSIRPLWTDWQKDKLKTRILDHIDSCDKPNMYLSFRAAEKKSLPVRTRQLLNPRFQVAAMVILLAISSYAAWQWTVNKSVSVQSLAQIQKVMLPDGSIVWLKGNSKLIYTDKFTAHQRHLILQGEALFEIAKDPAHPFTIECEGLKTKVLGTSFNIKAGQEHVEVTVLTGIVTVQAHNKKGIEVMPREKAIYNSRRQAITKMATQENEAIAIIEGTAYDMHFEDVKVEKIMQRIENKFNVKIQVGTPWPDNLSASADFTDQSLDRTLTMVAEILDFTYTIKGDTVILQSCKTN